jgi:poly-gamma-glutamate capsule biosynthesis protein CapA/YwtB (metallophosphatase superfamily)
VAKRLDLDSQPGPDQASPVRPPFKVEICVIGLLVASLAAVAVAQSAEPGLSDEVKAVHAYEKGFKAHQAANMGAEQRYEDALRWYNESLEADREQPGVWWQIGWIAWSQQEWQGCLDAWDRARELDPSFGEEQPSFSTSYEEVRQRLTLQEGLQEPAAPPPRPPTAGQRATLRIAAGGDTMMGSDFRKGQAGLPRDGGASLFEAVADAMRQADVAFVNLEGPLVDGGTSSKCGSNRDTCYAFRTPTRYGDHLAAAGVDVVSLANNHAFDFGQHGLDSTKATLGAHEIAYAGSLGDIARWSVGDLRLSLLAFAPNRGCYSLNDLSTAVKLVEQEAGESHLVIVSFHGGAEGAKYQNVAAGSETFYGENRGDLRGFARAVVDAGADLVLGHGPHVLRAMEVYRERLIAYSLGNFVTYGGFNLSGPNGLGALLVADLDTSGAFVGGYLVPTIQYAPGGPVLDPDKRAISKIRDLSQQDFPDSAPIISADGKISPTAVAVGP